jgi:hypothetical protein
MKRLFSILIFLVTATSWGAEVFWLKLNVDYSYRDPGTECTNGLASHILYFGAEVENGRVVRASLREYPFPTTYPSGPDFLAWEIARVSLHKDDEGRYWIKDWTLSPRLAAWFLVGPNINSCKPKATIATVEPTSLPFVFELEGVSEDILVSHSKRVNFEGLRKDGVAFRAHLKFQQRQYDPTR